MAGWADLISTKAWRPPQQCRQWSVHCLGDTNTCSNRNGYSCYLAAARRRRGSFFLVDLRLGAAFSGVRIEINTVDGYSRYMICHKSRHRMVLQLITKFNIYSLFSNFSVFVFVCLCPCLIPCICHCICLFYLYYAFHDLFPAGGRGVPFVYTINDPYKLKIQTRPTKT